MRCWAQPGRAAAADAALAWPAWWTWVSVCRRRPASGGEVRLTRAGRARLTGWGDTQLRIHLDRLASLEYVLVHRGMRGQSYEYELAFDGDAQAAAWAPDGLIDWASLDRAATTF